MIKHKKLVKHFKNRFKKINELSPGIVIDFNADSIHDFRVEVKKLRAFLRLLDLKKPLIPGQLKSLYDYTGTIRNIQLLKQAVLKYVTEHNSKKPETFLQLLTGEEDECKKAGKNLMKHISFHSAKEETLKKLPHKLKQSTIKKFIQNKVDDLQTQLNSMNDAIALHTIRKILKDILYNWRYIKHTDLPPAISTKDKLKTLTAALGDFIDKHVQLTFLNKHHLDAIKNAEEKNLLLKIKRDWLAKKNKAKQQLQHKLNDLL